MIEAKRSYNNHKRAQKRQKTRQSIVTQMVQAMARGEDDLPVAELARQSGVSLRTVYQHFPDKRARSAAIDEWIKAQVNAGEVLPPQSFTDIPSYVERLVDYLLENETMVRAQMAPGLSKPVRSQLKLLHTKFLRLALKERATNMAQIDRLTALIISMVRAEAVYDLRDIYGFTPGQIKQEMRRLVELVLQDSIA